MKQKIEKINNLNDKIETNKKFLELLKIGGTYLRDKDNNVTNLEKENRFLEIGIGVTVHSQEGGCNSKFEWTKDTFLMNNLKIILIERTEKHIEMQEQELLSFFK